MFDLKKITHYFCQKRNTIQAANNILSSPIGYLKGVGPQRAELLQKELNIYTFEDLLQHFPFRHVDKTKITPVAAIGTEEAYVQVAGILGPPDMVGERRGRRLVATLRDASGTLELVWFQSIHLIRKIVQPGQAFIAYGKVSFFMGQPQMVHPELEAWDPEKPRGKEFLEPVYPSTEKLKARSLGGRQIGKLTAVLLQHITEREVPENIPDPVLQELKLLPRYQAYKYIHFPKSPEQFQAAVRRLKFEEILFAQLRMHLLRSERHRFSKGVVFEKVGALFNRFYNECLPFELTGAQKHLYIMQ